MWGSAAGADTIDTKEERADARDGWLRIICTRLDRQEGATLDQLETDPRMAWFHLRLTRNEIASLLWSAKVAHLVEHVGDGPKDRADVLNHPGLTWTCTSSATENRHYVELQRGASTSDMLKHVRPWFSSAQAIGAAAAGALAGGIFAWRNDLADEDQPLLGITAFLAAVVALAVLAVYWALRDEKVLRRMFDAWPRGQYYRCARNRFEHMRRHSVGPWVFPPLVAAVALAAGVWLWDRRDQISPAWMHRGYAAAAVIFVAAALGAFILHTRAWDPRRQWVAEEKRRANPPGRTKDVLRQPTGSSAG